MILGDLGAQVIKVERPGTGDDTRQWGPPFAAGPAGAESAYYLCANRNKRSLAADLNSPEDRELVRRLTLEADVVVENFAPGTAARWGLSYEALAGSSPGLVYCTISGYGATGPEAGRPGYDFAIQARAGWMSITGEPDGEPMKTGVALVDVLAGQNAAIAILAALRERTRSGKGQQIEISLFDSALAGLINVAQATLVTGTEPVRYGNAHPTIVPYQAFETASRPIVVAVGNDAQWQRLCAAMGQPSLAEDDRFSTNPARIRHRAELVALLGTRFRRQTAAAWLERLENANVPCAPVQTVGEALREPLLRERGGLWETEGGTFGRVRQVASPLRLSRTPASLRHPPPALGEHGAEITACGWEQE